MEEIELSSEDALFLSYLDQEMEAKSFAYLVQAQKQEYLKGHEEIRLLSVRMTVISLLCHSSLLILYLFNISEA